MDDPDSRDLGRLLELACDRIDPPGYVEDVATRARRRRARRTALGAAAAVALLVAGVSAVPTPARAPSQLRPPVSSGGASATAPPAADGRRYVARLLDPRIVQPRWDPRGVDALPPAGRELARDLPATALSSIDRAPTLADDPIGIAQAVVPALDGASAMLLGTSGEWRSVELLGRYSQVALSPRGRCLLVRSAEGPGEAVMAVDDLATGERRTITEPTEVETQDSSRVRWLDDERFLLDDGAGGWVIDASTGEAQRVPYPTELRWAVDGAGAVVEATGPSRAAAFTDWALGTERVVADPVSGALSSWQVSRTEVAGTALRLTSADTVEGSTTAGFAVVVADRRTGTPTAALPVLDVEGNYSGGGLGVLAVRDDGIVLLRTSSFARDGGEEVVAWDPDTGDLSRVASFPVGDRRVDFAPALLTGDGP